MAVSKRFKKDAVHAAKVRSQKSGLECTITTKDITVPEYCPILGIKLVTNHLSGGYNSPSLDRIDNSKGYTPDNIWVISSLANAMKNEANPEQLVSFGRWTKTYFGWV